jgi:nucleotide-binding universal stress UspA family protein
MTSLCKKVTLPSGLTVSKVVERIGAGDTQKPEDIVIRYGGMESIVMVVLGSHQEVTTDRSKSKMLLGSFTQMAFVSIEKPCLGVRVLPEVNYSRINSIIVPVDGSFFSKLAIDMAVQIQKARTAEIANSKKKEDKCVITLIHAIETNDSNFHLSIEEAQQEKAGLIKVGEEILKNAQLHAEAIEGIKVSITTMLLHNEASAVEAKDNNVVVYDPIVAAALDVGADLIVMGSHGKRGVRKVLGTRAERVLRQFPAVLCVKK